MSQDIKQFPLCRTQCTFPNLIDWILKGTHCLICQFLQWTLVVLQYMHCILWVFPVARWALISGGAFGLLSKKKCYDKRTYLDTHVAPNGLLDVFSQFWSKVISFHKFLQIGEKLDLVLECFQRPQDWGFKYNFPSESIFQIDLVSRGEIY